MKKFGIRDNLAYLAGDLANDFTFILASSFLMIFYTNVLGVSGALVGTLFLTSRIVDAFTDIGMGRIVDMRTPGPEGKFRFWIIRVAPFVSFAAFLMFLHWAKYLPYGLKVVYIFATYLFWGSICYTAINIPYGSMASVITDVPEERTQLSSFRSIGASIAVVLINFIVPGVIYVEKNGKPVVVDYRFTLVAAICGILAFIFYIYCYKNTVERIQVTKSEKPKTSILEEIGLIFKSLITNKPLFAFASVAIVLILTMMLVMGLNIYLYQFYFASKKALQVGGAIGSIGAFILLPFVKPLAKKFGKNIPGIVGLFFTAIAYFLLFIFKIKNPWVFVAAIFVSNLGYTFFNLTIWSYISDVIDAQEVKTGVREDGTIYGVYSFSRKIGQALAGGLAGFALSMIGFVPGSDSQTLEVATSIYNVYTLVGAIGYLIAGLLLWKIYPLGKQVVENNAEILRQRREGK